MSVELSFDANGHPEVPTLILAKKNGDKLGKINARNNEGSDMLNDAEEFSFTVNKYVDGVKDYLWEQIVDFKLVYCVEWDSWFEIKVEFNESTESVKTVSCKQLGQSELSQIMLYNIEINTESDVLRDDYDKDYPTVLYRDVDNADEDLKEKYRNSSLLHRIMEKAPHYKVIYVDPRIANIERQFSFDGMSLYDALQKIAEEIHCIFVFNELPDDYVKGDVPRTISVYDLESTCNECGHRDDFFYACSKCGSEDIKLGYGEDTTIFITSDELAESIQLTSNADSVKNCFRLEAGDDLMTAYVAACNPNGTSYIWNFSDDMKSDMSQELQDKIAEYDVLYKHYQNDAVVEVDANNYNKLVDKYINSKVDKVAEQLVGYPALMQAYFGTIDFDLYLRSGLLPSVELYKTNAKQEAEYLEEQFASTPVAVSSLTALGSTTADNAVLDMAEALIDPRYEVEILEEKDVARYSEEFDWDINELVYKWTGKFTVTSIAYEEEDKEMTDDDTGIYKYTSDYITVTLTDSKKDYEVFVKQKVDKILAKNDVDDLSITKLFEKELNDFKETLRQYGLNSLSAFDKACEACINILITESSSWGKESSLNEFYSSYIDRQTAIRNEMKIRESELAIVSATQDAIEEEKVKIQNNLNFESFLGEELMLEFSCFRREDKYSNSNYISDGLSTGKLFENAYKFIEVANKEIKKSSELQHSITTVLKNLLAIPKFKPLAKKFKVGNWCRIMIDDVIYRFRLIKFTINYEDLDNIQVEFSDVANVTDSITSVKDIISQASSMATSYSTVMRQAKQGEESKATINDWSKEGLDATLVNIINSENQTQKWNDDGMLFREYDPITDTYSPEQMKIINSTMAVTDDNWETIKTAVGKFNYIDKKTNEVKTGYGLNAEAIVGQFIMGENIILENEAGTLSFNENGLYCESQRYSKDDIWTDYDLQNAVIIKPTSSPYDPIIGIKRNIWYTNDEGNEVEREDYVFAVNIQGDVKVVGNITANSLNILDAINNDTVVGLAKYAQTDASGEVTPDGKAAFSAAVGDTSFEINVSGGSGGTEAQNYSLSQLHPIAFTGSAGDIHGLHNVSKSGLATDLDQQSFITAMANNIKDDAVGLTGVAFTGHASNLDGLATIATTGSYADIPDAPDPNTKLDNPENQYTATEGQILMKTADGSKWIDLSELKTMLDALV